MKTVLIVSLMMLFILLHCPAAPAEASSASQGKQEFEQHCAVCHSDGGNIINPTKTLHKKSLAAKGIGKPADIVGKMRNPGPGMTEFDKKTIPDESARAIAEYILKTFQ